MTELINRNKRTSVSIPRSLILEIDRERGDVSRSRFLLRILEKSRTKENRSMDERTIGG
jgi:metal-responsive CopG/Arc/MetJ family transcriptional regulator